MRTALFLVAAVLVVTAQTTLADDLRVLDGDRLKATLDPIEESDTFRFVAPAGATVTVKAKAARWIGRELVVALHGPTGARVVERVGKSVSLKQAALAESGEYRVVVSATRRPEPGQEFAGPYAISISWKERAKFVSTVTAPAGGTIDVPFAAGAGSVASLSVRPARGSAATAALVRLAGPGGATTALSGTSAIRALSETGDHVLSVQGGASGGAVVTRIRLRPAKAAKRRFRLDFPSVPRGGTVFAAGSAGPAAGGVAADPAGPLAGASASIPAGALRSPTGLVLGVARPIETSDPSLGSGGPAVVFGPDGLPLSRRRPASLTLPFHPAAFPHGTSGLRVFTRSTDGAVTEVEGLSIDEGAHTVRLSTPRLGVFQVLAPSGVALAARVAPADLGRSDLFGYVAAVDGDYAIVGAPGQNSASDSAQAGGAAYVYHRSAGVWSEVQKLARAVPQQWDLFGAAVGISGDTIIVGVPGDDHATTDAGALLVYERSGDLFELRTELTASNAAWGDIFGQVAAIQGDTIVVGAPRNGGAGASAGTAYVFVRRLGVWTEVQEIRPADLAANAQYPSDIAVSGDRVIAGSPFGVPPGPNVGAAYVWVRSAGVWTEDQKLHDESPSKDDLFGWSVAIDGDTAVVGAGPPAAPIYGRQRTAHVFVRGSSGWTLQAKLAAPSDNDLGQFGLSVAIAGDVALVGSPFDMLPNSVRGGSAYAFERSSGAWRLRARLTAPDAPTNAQFGYRVAVSGSSWIVGATGAQAAYVFDLVP